MTVIFSERIATCSNPCFEQTIPHKNRLFYYRTKTKEELIQRGLL